MHDLLTLYYVSGLSGDTRFITCTPLLSEPTLVGVLILLNGGVVIINLLILRTVNKYDQFNEFK